MITTKEKVKLIYEALDEKKGEDIKIIDISKISPLADYFIVSSGNNKNQVQAMVDSVQEVLGKQGIHHKHIEGFNTGKWILLDYQDIVVHIFDQEDRTFYNLERVWKDGTFKTFEEL